MKIIGTTAFQGFDGFFNFKGVTDSVSKRLIHIGKQADRLSSGQFSDFHHQIG